MSRVVRLEQGDFALHLLFRDLAEDVFGEIMLKFAEGGHPVVDPIEQHKNCETGKRSKAKPDKQAHDQAGSHRHRRGSVLHNTDLITCVDDLRHADSLGYCEAIVECFWRSDFPFTRLNRELLAEIERLLPIP